MYAAVLEPPRRCHVLHLHERYSHEFCSPGETDLVLFICFSDKPGIPVGSQAYQRRDGIRFIMVLDVMVVLRTIVQGKIHKQIAVGMTRMQFAVPVKHGLITHTEEAFDPQHSVDE